MTQWHPIKEPWTDFDVNLYANLLHIQATQLTQHRYDSYDNRNEYFLELPKTGDLFLDPDTGIKTGTVKRKEHYLTPNELNEIAKKSERRLVIAYQHVRAQQTRERINNVLNTVRLQSIALSCVSYESGTVALLFFGLESGRVKAVRNYFHKTLGTHANKRIGYWPS